MLVFLKQCPRQCDRQNNGKKGLDLSHFYPPRPSGCSVTDDADVFGPVLTRSQQWKFIIR